MPGMRSITSTLREERPGTGRGTTTAGSAGEPPAFATSPHAWLGLGFELGLGLELGLGVGLGLGLGLGFGCKVWRTISCSGSSFCVPAAALFDPWNRYSG